MSWPDRIALTDATTLLAAVADLTNLTDLTTVDQQARARAMVGGNDLSIIADTVNRTGAVIVTGTPLADAVPVVIASALGLVTARDNGHPPALVHDLRSGTASGYDTAELGLHNDSVYTADRLTHLGLLCARPCADGGGRTILLRARDLADHVALADPRHLDLLRQPRFPFVKSRTGHDPLVHIGPVLTETAVSVHRRHLDEGMAAYPDLVDRASRAALDSLLALLDRPDFRTEVALAPGDLLIVDNSRVLHGRTALHPGRCERRLRRVKVVECPA
jgi:hypothetical protein